MKLDDQNQVGLIAELEATLLYMSDWWNSEAKIITR